MAKRPLPLLWDFSSPVDLRAGRAWQDEIENHASHAEEKVTVVAPVVHNHADNGLIEQRLSEAEPASSVSASTVASMRIRPRIEFEPLDSVNAAGENKSVPLSRREGERRVSITAPPQAATDSPAEGGKNIAAADSAFLAEATRPQADAAPLEDRQGQSRRIKATDSPARADSTREPEKELAATVEAISAPAQKQTAREVTKNEVAESTITPLPARRYEQAAAGKAEAIHPSASARDNALPARPAVPTNVASMLPEFAPAPPQESPWRETIGRQQISSREASPPKLTINRLEIQIVNQAPTALPQPTSRQRPLTASCEAAESLERRYLGRFFLL